MKSLSQQGLQVPKVNFDVVVCGGGLDQITPLISLKGGVARYAVNWEAGVTGGYTRIAGYERFDGQVSPTDGGSSSIIISTVATPTNVAIGDTVENVGGSTGLVIGISGKNISLCSLSGFFAVGDALTVGVLTVGTVADPAVGPASIAEAAALSKLAAAYLRTLITAVPGSGPVRGVVMFKDVLYAFRDNALATACAIYKSTAAGWVEVPLFSTVSFTAGTTAPADGSTLTKGGVTALIKRVVKQSGAWTGSAAGQFIITSIAGGHFSAGAATIGPTTVTLSGAETAITIAPGGSYELIVHNFFGADATNRVYGVDGKNKLFDFDGVTYVPIATGASPDTPRHLVAHRDFLIVSVKAEFIIPAPGDPYDWTGLSNATYFDMGEEITGLVVMPGGTTTGTLGVFSRNNTGILYGKTTSDFNFALYNTGSGAIHGTALNMAQTLAFDDRGAISIQAALQYGNFAQTTLTASILPFVKDRLNKCVGATLCRSKSQYRLFFSDGWGLYITINNNKPMGCMPVYFPNVVSCTYEGKTTTGQDVNFFGGTDGFVYQLDKGTSFDGDAIEWTLRLVYSNAKSPRVKKRYRMASVEVSSQETSDVTMDIGYILGYGSERYFQPGDYQYNTPLDTAHWDLAVWDTFYWDPKDVAPITVDISAEAENIALVFSGVSDSVAPYTINSIIVHYTPRRVMR